MSRRAAKLAGLGPGVRRGGERWEGGQRWALAAAVLGAAMLVGGWPGVADYDSVDQYRQALDGHFLDWHPPVMAAWWRLLHQTVGGAGAPMFAAQMAAWWAGIALIAAGLAGAGRRWAATAVLVIGAWPPFVGWEGQLLKDAQMAAALLLATGLVAHARLRGRRLGPVAAGAVAVLVAYAMLVRANAVFSVAPLGALLWPGGARARAAVGAALLAAGLGLAGPVNHGLLGAERTGVERTEARFDLAGIAARTPAAVVLPLTAAERETIAARHCSTPYFWDPLGEACDGTLARLDDQPVGAMYRDVARAVVAAPFAYLRHRLSHLNATERWWVPWNWPGAAPSLRGEANTLGLGRPGAAAVAFEQAAGWLAAWPTGWPVVWLVMAAGAAATALARPRAPARDLALALAASALGQEGSFALLSIASDLRYHLWPMLAAALAAVLLADRPPPRRIAWVAGGGLAVVVAVGLLARAMLPPAPGSYAAMLDERSVAAETF